MNTRNPNPQMPDKLRFYFGLFMALFMIAVGLMLLFNWFNVIYDPNWNLLRWVGGPLAILCGLVRAYCVIKGNALDKQYDDDEEDDGRHFHNGRHFNFRR